MPLPPAPTKPAAILPVEHYALAAPKGANRRKNEGIAAAAAAEPRRTSAPLDTDAQPQTGSVVAPNAADRPSAGVQRRKSAAGAPTARDATAPGMTTAQAVAQSDQSGNEPSSSPPSRGSVARRRPASDKTATALATSANPAQTSAPPAAIEAAPGPTQATLPAKTRTIGAKKLFVLDTNVLLHDPMSLFRFEEHDVFLPMIVLEELDGHKKGMTEVARNGRQASRSLDTLASAKGADINQGLPLNGTGHVEAGGKLFFQTLALHHTLPDSLPQGKADNQILGVVAALRAQHQPGDNSHAAQTRREVVLVSKDINMRIKARALGLPAEDYQNDKVLDDGDLLYSGSLALPTDFWAQHGKTMESWQQGAHTFYRVAGPAVAQLLINQFVYLEQPGEPSLHARVVELRSKSAVLKTLKDYTHIKQSVWGITARNREQNFALNLLTDPEIDFVTLTGTAGTGKTLLTLAAGLMQVLDDRRYTEIIMTRATVSVGEDIGFLPGTEEEKMGPWMGALDDNLEFLAKGDGGNAGEWGRAATNELIRSRIKIKSMNFMRGRTFLNKYVIIDEAQNLTPKQIKTLITRAGPGSKIVCMGNLAQIDTPYLTEGSSGLTYAVDKFKGWPHSGHIMLARGERSRLADYASEVL
jgi:PhoH-like ATPase